MSVFHFLSYFKFDTIFQILTLHNSALSGLMRHIPKMNIHELQLLCLLLIHVNNE